MCLTLNKTLHRSSLPGESHMVRAIKLDRPLYVIKGLRVEKVTKGTWTRSTYHAKDGIQISSPYRGSTWELNKERVEPSMILRRGSVWDDVNHGLHAMQSLDKFMNGFHSRLSGISKELTELFNSSALPDQYSKRWYSTVVPFPAIIPAGANIWFSRNRSDVCADRMTVYTNLDAMRKDWPTLGNPMTANDVVSRHRVKV